MRAEKLHRRTGWAVGLLIVGACFALLELPGMRSGGSQRDRARRERHAVWAHPGDAGRSPESVRQFVAQCKRANIDTIVMMVKGPDGEIYWQSRRFPQAIAKGYESFDLIEQLTREAHAQGISVHAWLCDFIEGVQGAAYREHPEWAQLNPDGLTTASEKLGGGRPYPYVWMCPARRPGYTDRWLLPMIEEIATTYPVDGIHHDYVRYPGDVAPDSYCFCDYCLQQIPRDAMLSYETRPRERYRVQPILPRLQANWWSDPTMLPADWEQRDRREKADFLFNGRTVPGGPSDMRYFFYDYRVRQIDRFAREAWERVKRVNSQIELSAAVFKNPIQSARFIGQHWDRWTAWVDVFMPMSYRSHFAGSFESYLDHLEETTTRQLEWIGRQKPLYAGIATTYLYREELQPLDEMADRINALKEEGKMTAEARAESVRLLRQSYEAVRERLAAVTPDRERELSHLVAVITAEEGRNINAATLDALAERLAKLRSDPPPGYFPLEKLTRAIEAARRARPDGIVIFSAGSLTREKLWPALEAAFRP